MEAASFPFPENKIKQNPTAIKSHTSPPKNRPKSDPPPPKNMPQLELPPENCVGLSNTNGSDVNDSSINVFLCFQISESSGLFNCQISCNIVESG